MIDMWLLGRLPLSLLFACGRSVRMPSRVPLLWLRGGGDDVDGDVDDDRVDVDGRLFVFAPCAALLRFSMLHMVDDGG